MVQQPNTRARHTRQVPWYSTRPPKPRAQSLSVAGAPALTARQRRAAIQAEADGAVYPGIFFPAAKAVVDFCRTHPFIGHAHLFALSLTTGVLAGLFLMGAGAHPLLRLWAGIFLFSAEVMRVAGGQLAHDEAAPAQKIHIAQGSIAIVVGFFVLAGATSAAAAIESSLWIWLLGIVVIASAALHALAFDAARKQYVIAAGGGTPEHSENLLEVSIRAHEALRRGDTLRAKFWQHYAALRQMQQRVVSPAPQGSADTFWRLNRKRMAAWTLLSAGAYVMCLSLAGVVSTFWPDALVAALWLIVAGGNALISMLLLLGWKTIRRSGAD